jgi:hypothetical protein
VLTAYDRWIKLPLQTPRFAALADLAWRQVIAREANPTGWVDTSTGAVTLSADGPASLEVTGIAGGSLTGGQSIRAVDLSATPALFTVDAALDR